MSATFEQFERALDALDRWHEGQLKKAMWNLESAIEDMQIARREYEERRASIMEEFKDACGAKAS